MPARVIGRILSLGFPLPGPQVDNYSLLSAPSFFDYDALVVDPRALSMLVEGVLDGSVDAATFAGTPVRNQPAAPGDVALGDLLQRRRDETARLLAHGGVVVCFLHPAVTHAVAGADGFDDYGWLPLPESLALRPPLVLPADGTQVVVVDAGRPLAAFVLSQAANIGYRARVEARLAHGVHVFARSRGGAAVGVELPSACGRIVLLPALAREPSGDARYALSNALQAGIRRTLGVVAEGRPPPWTAAHQLAGLDEREEALARARRECDAAGAHLRDAEEAHEALARYRRLLWQEGAADLDEVVLDALRLIGFDVYAHDPAALEVRCEGTHALLDIEASEHDVDLVPHYRLRQRVERAIERTGAAPRALLFVNGRRLQPTGQRARQVTDALRVASETMRYRIATTASLFDAVAAKLAGDEQAVAAYRRSLLTGEGILP